MGWVVEINGFDTVAVQAKTVVYAMGVGVAFPDSTHAPSGFFSWKSANQKVNVAAAGGVQLSADTGQLILQNLPNDIAQAGPLDTIATTWAFQNRRANLYWIGDGTWANRQLVDTAILQQPFATLTAGGDVQSTLVFQLRDPRALLAVPLQPTKFLGTNSGGQGVEGEADLKGRPKPILYGVVSNISPPRVNASQLIYQVADRPASILCVRDGGLGIAAGTIRATLATLQSNSPTPGTYDSYAGAEGTFFKLGTTPVFQVTCDAQEGAARSNAALQSQTFGTTWVTTAATVTSDTTAAPDGSVTADTVTRTATTASDVRQDITKVALAQAWTVSAYAKLSSGNFVALRLEDGAGNHADACFNINTGAISLAATQTGTFLGAIAAITGPTSGYYRVSLSAMTNTATTLRSRISSSSVSQQVDGTGSANATAVILWGAQVELGIAPTPYIATTTAAVSVNRTNLDLQSEAANVTWTLGAMTITADGATNPSGLSTADIAVPTVTNTAHEVSQTVTTVAGVTYTLSGYFAPKGYKNLLLRLANVGETSAAQLTVDVSAGVVTVAANTFGGSVTLVGSGISVAGNGYYRVWITATFTSATSLVSAYYVENNAGASSYAGDGVSGIAAWGLMLEAAAAPSQYIRTTTVAASDVDMSNRTHAQVWARARLERAGNVPSDLTVSSLAAADALDPNEVGFWWADDMLVIDAINAILTSFSGFEVEDFAFHWSFQKLLAPSGTTVLDFVVVSPTSTLTSKNRALRSLTSVRADFAPEGAPPYRVTVNWGRNYTVLNEADFAGAAPQRLRDKFAQEFRAEVASNTAIWDPVAKTGPWSNAPELAVNTAYQPGTDGLTSLQAVAEAQRLVTLYSANKGQFQLDFTPKVTDQILAGNVCSLAYGQLGLSGGPLFVVLQSALEVSSEIARMSLVLGFQT